MNSKITQNKNIVISVTLTTDGEIQTLNKDYLGRDYPTDVLAFNIDSPLEAGDYYLGDVVVNKEQAQRQAAELNISTEEEISNLVQHGVLHLLGVHHEGDD